MNNTIASVTKTPNDQVTAVNEAAGANPSGVV